jgi:hypothetical protein
MEGYRAILTAFVVKLLKEKLIVEDDFDELFFIYNLKLITYYYLNIEEDKLMSFYFFKVLGQSILYQL